MSDDEHDDSSARGDGGVGVAGVGVVPQERGMSVRIGSRWRGASGDVATVKRIVGAVAYGKWDSGILWIEHLDWLPKMYVEVDGGPTEERPS